MAISPISKFLQNIRRAALRRDEAELTDGQLLDAYVHSREEAAFAALLHRHGPMVWGVCRRILGHHQDAEDAFQATFLVLVRNAAATRKQESLAAWLHGVAWRIAHKARMRSARQQARPFDTPPSIVRDDPRSRSIWLTGYAAFAIEVRLFRSQLDGFVWKIEIFRNTILSSIRQGLHREP
jgi:DNA-directed RNA polymerase specialized sigma24 family protein